jgi:hypothetical protein
LELSTALGDPGGMGQGACMQDGVPCQLGESGAFSVGPQRIFRSAAGGGKIAEVIQNSRHQVIRVRLPRQTQPVVQVLRSLIQQAKGQVHIPELAQDGGGKDRITRLLNQCLR